MKNRCISGGQCSLPYVAHSGRVVGEKRLAFRQPTIQATIGGDMTQATAASKIATLTAPRAR
jgi:hypothetical protein